MSIELETAHVVTRLLVSASFVAAAATTAYRRRIGYTIFYVLAAIEMYANVRYGFVAVARQWLLGNHPSDPDKYAIQVKVLIAAAALGTALGLAMLLRMRRRPAELALALGTSGVLAVLAVETISYHFVDAFIYTMLAGVTRSGWVYIMAALVAAGGALSLRPR